MRNLHELNRFRVTDPDKLRVTHGWAGNDTCGAFFIRMSNADKTPLFIIASVSHGWDHVSVSLPDRCPTWEEMAFVARRFFKPDEIAYQLHVPSTIHINNHPFCLHWWRPHNDHIPIPPTILVGFIDEVDT